MDKIEEIKEYIENNRIASQLISNKYEGWNKKLEFKCECGNVYLRTFGHFKGGQVRCQKCSGKQKITLEGIRDFLKSKGSKTIVIDTIEPAKNNSKVKFICGNCNEGFEKNWATLKKGNQVCNKCSYAIGGVKGKIGIEKARELFGRAGYALLEDTYTSNSHPMRYRCGNGHIYKTSYNDILKGRGCAYCSRKRIGELLSMKLSDVLNKLEKDKFTFISSDSPFVNGNSYVEYKCPNNHTSKTKARNITCKDKVPCKQCFIDSVSGENSSWWNKELTEEDRSRSRKKEETEHFRKGVFNRDNYTCQKCKDTGGKLNAHHLDGYNWCIEKRGDTDNGATLCKSCHINFHSKFGSGSNTKEQYYKWLKGE